MHWLTEQLQNLQELLRRYTSLKGLAEARAVSPRSAEEARRAFFSAVSLVTIEIQKRPGIAACFVCHDGLLVEHAGSAASFEALAAVAQSCVEVARNAAASSLLGDIRQMVLVGADSKLAIFSLGPIAVGIQSPVNTNLAQSLAA